MSIHNQSPESLIGEAFTAWLSDTYGDLVETGELEAIHVLEALEDLTKMLATESRWHRYKVTGVRDWVKA